jgi:DNA replication protein DnaC
MFGDPTYADAILDRLLHNAHRIDLAGDSLRKKRKTEPAPNTPSMPRARS